MATQDVVTGHIPLFTKESKRLLKSLRVVGKNIDEEESTKKTTTVSREKDTVVTTITGKSGISCSVCQVEFDSVEGQREHFKFDWHRFNLRQSLMGKPVVTEETFEETVSGDVSSISGSDTNSDDDLSMESSEADLPISSCMVEECPEKSVISKSRLLPKVFFVNSEGLVLSLFRSTLYSAKVAPETTDQLISLVSQISNEKCWLVLLTSGGHFAAAVFDGSDVVAHKTFHRYTVRAKRGTAQSVRDGQQGGKAPKSAGAALRRHNEAALVQGVQGLLESWSGHIERCHRIFVRIPEYNKNMIFGGKKPPISKGDTRLRKIPFSTRRPTFNEVKRVHAQLCSVEVLGVEADVLHNVMEKFQGVKPKIIEDDLASKEKPTPEKDELQKKEIELGTERNVTPEVHTKPVVKCGTVVEDLEDSSKPKNATAVQTKKKKTKTKKGHKTELAASPQLHLWNRLYCACVSGNIDVISSFLRTNNSNKSEITGKGAIFLETNTEFVTTEIPELKSLNQELKSEISDKVCKLNDDKDTVGDSKVSQEIVEGNSGVSTSQSDRHEVNVMEVMSGCYGDAGDTLLHGASRYAHSDVITLLLEHGADPSVRDNKGRTPYNVAGNKESRNTFRRFMAAHPDRYDYAKAQIPSPLTSEMEEEKDRKNAEMKKAQRKARKDRLKVQKAEEKKKEEELQEKNRLQSLSAREKRALAAEKRFAQQKSGVTSVEGSLCEWCSNSLAGLVPFERLSYKYCTTTCVTAHRKALESQAR